MMTDAVVDSLILDLLEWLERRGRSYREVMDAWRTSCPRLPVWEEAIERGFVAIEEQANGALGVAISASGTQFLKSKKIGRGSVSE